MIDGRSYQFIAFKNLEDPFISLLEILLQLEDILMYILISAIDIYPGFLFQFRNKVIAPIANAIDLNNGMKIIWTILFPVLHLEGTFYIQKVSPYLIDFEKYESLLFITFHQLKVLESPTS